MSLRYGLPMPYLSIARIIDSSKKIPLSKRDPLLLSTNYTVDKKFVE